MTVTWDSGFAGAHVALSGGNLTAQCGGNQEWIRATLGHAPNEGGAWQWEISVPAGGSTNNFTPEFGVVTEDRAYGDGSPGYSNDEAWSFGFGTNGLNPDYSYHHGTSSTNWTGGSTGGLPKVVGFVLYMATGGGHNAGDLDIYIDGVYTYTKASVIPPGGNAKKLYPYFGSGGSGSVGTFYEQGTAHFKSADIVYPVVGASAWQAPTPPVAAFTRTPTSGGIPLSVAFTDTSTNTPTSWLWVFGDGGSSTLQNPTHIFITPGTYTVSLTATNADGSSSTTHTVTATGPVTARANDWRCQGAKYIVVSASTGKTAFASPQTRRVVVANSLVDVSAWAESGELDAAPGAVVYDTELWTVCDDANVRKLDPSTAATLATVYTGANVTTWLAQNAEGYVIAPGAQGMVATVHASAVVDTCPALPRIDAAAYDAGSRYLYCVGNARGAVVAVSAAGALSKVAEFVATGCRDVRRAKVLDDGTLAVVCKNRIVTFGLDEPTAPVVEQSTSYTEEVFSVMSDGTAVTATDSLGFGVPVYEVVSHLDDYIFAGPTAAVQVVTA